MGEEVLAFTQDMGMRNENQTTKQTWTCLFIQKSQLCVPLGYSNTIPMGGSLIRISMCDAVVGIFPWHIWAGMCLMMAFVYALTVLYVAWWRPCQSALIQKHTGIPQTHHPTEEAFTSKYLR